jgi:hypothetical protein
MKRKIKNFAAGGVGWWREREGQGVDPGQVQHSQNTTENQTKNRDYLIYVLRRRCAIFKIVKKCLCM